jgi:hypothetical protein
MIVRREEFQRLGGFDSGYFAYLEDVDFGWRAWSAGRRIVFAPEGLVHHRSGATGDRLGNARRGFLFERNAFMTAYKNYDADLWPRMMPAILMTLVSRVAECLLEHDDYNHWLLQDPFGADNLAGAPALRGALRRFLAAVGLDRRVRLGVRAEAHLRTLVHIMRLLDTHAARREEVQSRRRISDRELFDRFPLYVVPTYPGDEKLFRSRVFWELLPRDIPVEHRDLSQVMEVS